MKHLAYVLLPLTIALLSTISNAEQTANNLLSAKKTAVNSKLAKHTDWKNLIQYVPRLTGGVTSRIVSQHSFFSKSGSSDPEQELLATIEAMFLPPKDNTSEDDHPRCKFIARYEFLNDFINFPDKIENLDCAQFKQWAKLDKVESISLVFASGYLKNPASFYGHPLLKFNTDKSKTGGLLDTTINNGAIVPENENPVVYMIKGIFGGYEAAFSDVNFYHLNHSYSESDLRDLWDYTLNLSDEQKQRVILYSWELLGQRFTYKFFKKNCGYFLENLLQYALGKRISPRNILYTVPSNTFFNIMQASNNGKPLVNSITRLASRHSRLNESYLSLSRAAQIAVENYLVLHSISDSFSPEQTRQINDTLTDYYSFLISKTDNEKKKNSLITERTKLYAKRLSIDATQNNVTKRPKAISSTPPHTGSRPSLMRFGLIHNSSLGYGGRIRLRPVNYDLLDLDDGHSANSTLNMFNIEASSINGKQRLTRFGLVDIKTLNISRTGLPGDGGLGWGLRLGLERANNNCFDCLIGQLSGSGIKAKNIHSNLTLYAETELSFHSSFENSSFRSTTTLGAIAKPTQWWKTQLVLGKRFAIDGDADSTEIAKWENRFGQSPKGNLRLDIRYDGTTEIQLGYGLYW